MIDLGEFLLSGPDRATLLDDLVVDPPGVESDQDIALPDPVPLAEADLDDASAGAGTEDLPAGGIEDPCGCRHRADTARAPDDEVRLGQGRPQQGGAEQG